MVSSRWVRLCATRDCWIAWNCVARLFILHRVSQAISTVLDSDHVLDEILKLARGALAFSRSADQGNMHR